MAELIYATTISGSVNVARTGPIRPPDSIHVCIYDDDEVIITTTGKINPSSPVEYQRPYLVEKLSQISSEPSEQSNDRGAGARVLLCEMKIRGVDPTTKSFRNRISVLVYDDGDVRHSATDDPVDADVVQQIIDVLQRSYGPRPVTRKPRVGDWVEVLWTRGDDVGDPKPGFFYVSIIVDHARDDAFGGRDVLGNVWRRRTDGTGWRWPVASEEGAGSGVQSMPRLDDYVEVRLVGSDWARRKVEEFRLLRTEGVVFGVYDGITLLWFNVSDRGKSWRPVTS